MNIKKYVFITIGLTLVVNLLNKQSTKPITVANNMQIEHTQPTTLLQHADYNTIDLKEPFDTTISNNNTILKKSKELLHLKTSQITPDYNRSKEDLEKYPLDSLTVVGTIKQKNETWVLISDYANSIHKVKKGNYLGKNFGQIKQINEDDILLDEIVPDNDGGWIVKQTNLKINKK